MAFVPQHEYDIFVSYAHVDNEPLPGATEGWVSTLVQALTKRLAQLLGRRDAFRLWMDYELAGNRPLTPEIMQALHGSATLLVILSPGYLASEWCKREMNTFLRTVGERVRAGSRVFIVERHALDLDRRPAELQKLLGYRFWVADRPGRPPRILGDPRPHPEGEPLYYERLNDLSYELAAELQRLQEAVPEAEASEAAPAVFLADVTDDLDPLYDEVKRYLAQAGLRVLPDAFYAREPVAFQKAVDDDLSQCDLFVQLLSGVAGRKPPGLRQGYTRLQYERAQALQKPLLQWRSPDLDLTTIQDTDHHTFVQGETVLAVRIEEFKQTIVQRARARPEPEPPTARSVEALVFVNADAGDDTLAQRIGEFLASHDIASVFAIRAGEPEEIRKDLEQNLRYCDAVMVIYGTVPLSWVRQQLMNCLKQAPRREQPLKIFAVYEGPPDPKSPLGVMIPNLHVVNGRSGLHTPELQTLIDILRG